MRVTVKLIIGDAFGMVAKGLEELTISERIKTLLTTALLKVARILRRDFENWGDLLSLGLQWKTISKDCCEKLTMSEIIMMIFPLKYEIK